VATDDANTYFDIVSRLKGTFLRFSSLAPGEIADPKRDLVLTGKRELSSFGGFAVAIEDRSKDPLIIEGQIRWRCLEASRRSLLIGIDPGSRIGVVVFYGGRELGARTANSVEEVIGLLVRVAEGVPNSSLSVKIGGGEPRSAMRMARLMRERLRPSASIEIVNESGTSAGRRGTVGATRDERAATRIAFRKGMRFTDGARLKRTRG